MARTRQVRLEPDVVLLLETDGDHDGLSLSSSANRALRHAYRTEHGLDGPVDREPARTPPAADRRALATRGARLGARVPPGVCRHPVARRVGERCGQCGTTVR